MLAGLAAEQASGLTAAEGETHAAEAVRALRRHVAGRYATVKEAIESKYVDVHMVDKHFQFDSLRGRTDYQQLLAEMRAQKPANGP